MRFAGKIALVTGAAGGIGAAIVRQLRAEGARVAVADRDVSAVEADALLPGNLLDAAYADGLPQAAHDALGGLDIVVNNAGVITRGKVTETSDADWDLSVGVNVQAPFRVSRAAIPLLAARGGGAIVNTASSMARLPLGVLDGYAASKGGVALLTQSMAPGCGRLGIRVNAICPGYVDTPMNAPIWGNETLKEGFARGHATGLQTPEEIADLVVFLASDASRSLTGAVLACDRGWTAFKQPPVGG